MKTLKTVYLSPVTRLSGLLSVEVTVDGNTVVDARVRGEQFRGFEWMLVGRDIRDAPYFTERICGICSMAHAVASTYLLDALFEDELPPQAYTLRNIMFAVEFLQNHVRQFYAFVLPDYIRVPAAVAYQGEATDVRFSEEQNRGLVDSYLAAFPIAAQAHEALTVFAGKAPHQHGMVHGGVTVAPSADRIMHVTSLVGTIRRFITDRLCPDADLLSRTYQDYYSIGVSAGRFLSYGLFRTGPGSGTVWPAGVLTDGAYSPTVDIEAISEDVSHSWYEAAPGTDLVAAELTPPEPRKQGAYTFVKAVHYRRLPYEVGPLARLCVRMKSAVTPSTMERIVARSVEAERIGAFAQTWLSALEPGAPVLSQREAPRKARATAVTDAPRGALLHDAEIDGMQIVRYGIITPTAWNFSPLNAYGLHGPVEQALIGTVIRDPNSPVEIGRIVRAFDPCLSCGTHLIRL